ncbi:MAG: T9SS type A sorting domain-containing protein [Tannerellaceae bacterium]|jgi:hypothetical protein|nr:T9SS type A sorting domain-containing protein [Tannerellaceae bacterium]
MKRVLYLSAFICCFLLKGFAQGAGAWKSHASYHNTTAVAEAENNVFAVANGSLYSYNKEDNSYRTYTKKEGELSDSRINTIAYNPTVKTLLIVYSNGNIDLLNENGIYNIPFLMQATIADKTVNHTCFNDKYAYLSTAFGIMVLNMGEKEITDTYRTGYPVYSTCIHNNNIYAATSRGILYCPVNNNPLDPGNWVSYPVQYTGLDEGNAKTIVVFQNRLTVLVSGQGIYVQQDNTTFSPLIKNSNLANISVQNSKLLAHTPPNVAPSNTYVWFSLTEYHTLPTGVLSGISSLKDDKYWVASGNYMLRGLQRKGNTSGYEWFVSGISIDSPMYDYAAFMTFAHNKLWVGGGGRWANPFYRPGAIMIYDGSRSDSLWYNLNHPKVAVQTPTKGFNDVTSIAVDPNDETHYFASTWGIGVLEFKDNELVQVHNATNSTLESITGNPAENIRVDGLCYDREGNLWMTNSEVTDAIKILSPGGEWSSLYFSPLSRQYLVDKILITSGNQKWVNLLRGTGSGGILVFDGATDEFQFYQTFKTRNSAGGVISAGVYYCMAEDMNGQIWIGTNLGPIVCPTPSNAIADPDNMYANRIVREDEYGNASLFMDGESVRAIAVDGANRKWLGTQNSGILLVSADGMETVEHFTAENSPLPSNYVESIAINHETGEVFIGTDKGIVSYMGSATVGKEEYSNVYAYPNPVRPDFQGDVTITGLMQDSDVKITDINGNLIVRGKSLGGQFIWNCRKGNGSRVSTGIYLVLASEPSRGESVVAKIMVIK